VKQGCVAWLFSSAWRLAGALLLAYLGFLAGQRYVWPVISPVLWPVVSTVPTPAQVVEPVVNRDEPPVIAPMPTATPFVPNLKIGAMIVSADLQGRTSATAVNVGFVVSPGRGDTTIMDVDGDTLRCEATPSSVADLERCEQMVAAAESADLPDASGVYTNTYSNGQVYRCTNVLKSASGVDRCQEVGG
jgi:hypothetical protein